MTSSCHDFKFSTTFVLQRGLRRTMMTCKIVSGILDEIKGLGLGYMEHDYMHTKGHKRGHGTSGNLMVVAES